MACASALFSVGMNGYLPSVGTLSRTITLIQISEDFIAVQKWIKLVIYVSLNMKSAFPYRLNENVIINNESINNCVMLMQGSNRSSNVFFFFKCPQWSSVHFADEFQRYFVCDKINEGIATVDDDSSRIIAWINQHGIKNNINESKFMSIGINKNRQDQL